MAKQQVTKRKPTGLLDYLSLAVTTFGVGYLPLMPGTFGSLVAVGFYAVLANTFAKFRYTPSVESPQFMVAAIHAAILIAFLLLILLGIWAASRSIELLGDTDAPQAVVDEVLNLFRGIKHQRGAYLLQVCPRPNHP